jgi:hypothetical protein
MELVLHIEVYSFVIVCKYKSHSKISCLVKMKIKRWLIFVEGEIIIQIEACKASSTGRLSY